MQAARKQSQGEAEAIEATLPMEALIAPGEQEMRDMAESYEAWKRAHGCTGRLNRDAYCAVFHVYE